MPFFVPGIIVLISGYGAASVPAIQGASTLSIIAAAAGKYAYDCFNEPDLPTFQHEAEVRIEPELTSHYCRINSHVIAGMALNW